MKRIIPLLLALALTVGICPMAALAQQPLSLEGYIGIYSRTNETAIRSVDKCGYNLADVRGDEYASFCFRIKNTSGSKVTVRNSYMKVDGKTVVSWQDFQLLSGEDTWVHVYWGNMKNYGPGIYHAEYYANGEMIREQYFTLSRDWSQTVSLPSEQSIQAYFTNNRSPYICCLPSFPDTNRFTSYSVDVKADYDPDGTYLCGCNWDMDLGVLRKKYASVYRDYNGVAAYAGFQVWDNREHGFIMSVWNTYAKDKKGNVTTFRPSVTYSKYTHVSQPFDGEGSGFQCLVKYRWEAGKPYRMMIQQTKDEKTGNAGLVLWVCDLEKMAWERLIEYDLGIPSNYMTRAVVFLEDFKTSTAAKIRTMELSNFRAQSQKTGKWVAAKTASFEQNYDHPGSYAWGADSRSFWAITTGLPNVWTKPKDGKKYTVKYAESGQPF